MKPFFLALTLAAVVLTVPGCRSGKKDADDTGAAGGPDPHHD